MYSIFKHHYLLTVICLTLTIVGTLSKSNAQNHTIYPSSGSKGETLNVSIHGSNISFHQGSSTICPNKLNVNTSNIVFQQGSSTFNPTSVYTYNGVIFAAIEVPLNAYPGYYDVILGQGESCPAVIYSGFNVTNPSLNVYPSTANSGETLTVNIAGAGVSFHQGSPTVCPTNLDVNISNVIFKQGSSSIQPINVSTFNGLLYAQLSIPSYANGYYDVEVGNPGCSFTKYNGIYINQPSLTVSPNTANTGQSLNVTISGNGLAFTQGSSTICPSLLNVTTSNVVFQQGSTTLYPNSVSVYNNTIYASLNIPQNIPLGYYNTIVDYGGSCSRASYNSLNIQEPSVTLSPSSGTQNQQLSVSITGYGINFYQGSSTSCPDLNITTSDIVFRQGSVYFYPTSVIVSGGIIIADLQIPSNIPIGSYEMIIGANSGCAISKPNAFYITAPTIIVASTFYNDNTLDLTIQSIGINFTQSGNTVCPDLLNVNNNNVHINDGTSTIYPSSVNVSNGTLYCSFPSLLNPAAEFDLVVGGQSSCPYSTKFSIIVTDNSTSQYSESTATIYPNPSDGSEVTLDIKKQGIFDITIINPYGQAIGATSVNGPADIVLPEMLKEKLVPGIYMININDGNSVQHKKFIVQ